MDYIFSNRIKGVDGEAISEILKASADPSIISLAGGNPASELFPNKELAEIAHDLLINEPVLTLQYSVAQGYLPLREKIKEMIKERDNINNPEDDIIITSGSQQGIDFATKCLLNEGETVVVENPTFLGALSCFSGYGAHFEGVRMENDGMDIEQFESIIKNNKNVKFLYTIPSFQNPTGITLSQEKREKLYKICAENSILIIEDNPYGELTFDGNKFKTLKSMDTEGIVIYCGSFSKILAPGIRVGYIVANKKIIKKMAEAKQSNDTHSPMLTQVMTYEFLKRFDIGENIEKMRTLYKTKCKVLLDSVDEYFPRQVWHTVPTGGLFMWCDMGGEYDTIQVYRECIKEKVAFVPGAPFTINPNERSSAFRLNFSTMSNENIQLGVKLLGNKLHQIMK